MLQSITVRYDPAEDRIALRLAETDKPEGERWLMLTRRTCARLRHDLQAMAAASAQAPARLDSATRSALTAMHHQSQADQVPTHRHQRPLPLPDQTRELVAAVSTGRVRDDGRWVLRFELVGRHPIQITLTDETLHGVIRLLNRQIAAAEWGLPALDVEQAASSELLAQASRGYH